jgi:hypothetical protein
VLFTAAVATFFSCQKAEVRSLEDFTVLVSAEEIISKTGFGDFANNKYPTLWQDADQVKFSLNNSEGVAVSAVLKNDGAAAEFTVNFTDDASGAYTIYALSPASAAVSFAENNLVLNIPAQQNPTAASCDPVAQILYAQSATTTVQPTEFSAQFHHLTSYLKVNLENLPAGVVPAKLKLDFGAPVSGDFVYNASSDILTAGTLTNNTIEATATSADVWFACAPVDVSGKTINVEVVTADGITYTTTKSFPANRSMQSGTVYAFSVDMSNAEILYQKTLTPGHEGVSITGGNFADDMWKGLDYWNGFWSGANPKATATYTFTDVPVSGQYDIILSVYYWMDITSSLAVSVNGAAADSYIIRGTNTSKIVIKGVTLNAGENAISVTAGSIHKGDGNSPVEKHFPNTGWMMVTNCPNDYVQSEKVMSVSLTPGQAGVEAIDGANMVGSLVKGIWHWSERYAKFTFENITAGVYNITVNVDWWCNHEISTGITVNGGGKLSARVLNSTVKSVLFENVQLTEGTNVILVGKGDYISINPNDNNNYPNIGTVTITNY